MPLKFPESTEDCIYFTRRASDGLRIMCWVFKATCPKCKKALMGKPVEGGKVKIRAKEYICPSCGHSEEKVAHEEKLTANVQYTCGKCAHAGEIQIPFKRKSVDGTKALVFNCQKCSDKILITKKMKDPKKKGPVEETDDDE
ncbi:hypothetical protein HY492_02215 [Candidatus Woesearchaeota archaeon]|nr:hypothetical protein [Candidatus Woesearchaeota archaeon]